MNKGNVSSDQHVDVKLTNGTISSDRLRITGGGEVVRFEGNVVMHLDNMNNAPADPSASASAAPVAPDPAPVTTQSIKTRHSPGKSGNPK
jgi:lipopolysaccharide export system protein LptC